MQVTVGPDPELDRTYLLALDGRLDTPSTRALWKTVAPAVASAGTNLLVDMSGVTAISSAGLGILIRLRARLLASGGRMAIFGCRPQVNEVIEIVRLGQAFGVAPSAAEARRALLD